MGVSRTSAVTWGAFAFTLGALALGSFFPEARLWSLNQLGYLPGWTTIVFLSAAALTAVALVLLFHFTNWSISQRTYQLTTLGVLVVSVAAFVLFHTKSHFLGDGYTLISLLTSDNPIIKWRNFGGTAVPYGVLQMIEGNDEPSVLLAYRLVAYVAGGLFIVLAAWGARRLYEAPIDRLLMFLGLCAGGHMVLFFGYVENYALFIVAVAGYCLVGMAAVDRTMSRWWLLVPQGLAIFFHVFGVVLIPATLLVLLQDTAIGRRVWAMSGRMWWLLGAAMFALGLVVVFVIQQSVSSLTFMFLPVQEEWFTIDGYTMFSGKHLLDFVNQLLILWPGLLVAIGVLLWGGKSKGPASQRTVFLGCATFLSLAAAFVFDPKIGLARDWDLYAFAGLPLGLLLLDRLSAEKSGRFRPAMVLFAVAGILLVAVRATVLATPAAAFEQNHSYLYLDPIRNHNVWPVMIKYYMFKGDSTTVYALDRERNELLPEEQLLVRARQAMMAGDYEAAVAFSSRARARYRGMGAFHANYGSALLNIGRRDEAFEELIIARALNPYNTMVLANLGAIYFERGELETARDCWLETLTLEPNSPLAIYGMTMLYCHDGELEPLPDMLERGFLIEDMRRDFYPIVAGAALQGGDYSLGARALVLAKEREVSNDVIRTLVEKYPEVAPHLRAAMDRFKADRTAP